MGALSNLDGAGRAEKVSRPKLTLCPTCGQPTPDATGVKANPDFEPPESVVVLERRIHDRLRESFPEFKYHIWLQPLRLLWRHGEHLIFTLPAHVRTSFEERYLTVVIRLLQEAGWGAVTGEVVGEDWQPSPEQLAAGPSCEPAPAKRGPIANAPHKAMERTAEALLHETAAEMKPETVELLEDAVEKAKAAQQQPAGPRRRRRSDVTR